MLFLPPMVAVLILTVKHVLASPPRGWHDQLSGTFVVDATDIDAEKPEGVFRKAEVEF